MHTRLTWFARAIVVIAIFFGCGQVAYGQNLDIGFVETPDFINLCGDADTMIVQVSIDGVSPDPRTNISANIEFFKGVRFTQLIPGLTSAGVTMDNQTNPGNITISLPNLSPITPTADVAFLINGDCTYQDSINANNTAQVLDTWNFSYDLGASTGLLETDITPQYRDAFKNPQIQMQINSVTPPLRLNDCFTREVQIDNSGLQGYADSLIYVARQGNGLYVSAMYANGIPLTLTKTNDGSDTLITVTLTDVHFALNTIGNGGPLGNGDGRINPDETLIITEDICFIDCGGSLASFYTVGWGCYGSICETTNDDTFLDSGADEGFPAASIDDFDEPSFVDIGYCQTGFRSVQITNTGSEFTPGSGFGSMMDVDVAVVMGNGSSVMDDGIAVTELTIAGIVYGTPAGENRLDGIPGFESDPDGVGVGLEDEDGDGFYDDLPVGHSFIVDYVYENLETNRDSFDLDSNCSINDISTQVFARVKWKDPCEVIDNEPSSFYRIRNQTEEVVQIPDADADTDGSVFNVSLSIERSLVNFERNCGGSERLIVRTALIPDVTPDLANTDLFIGISTVPEPSIGKTISGDTLILEFDISGVTQSRPTFRTEFAFTAGCGVPEGRLVLPTTAELYCPTCDDRHLWFCDNMLGPQMHVVSPPCIPPTCPEGIKAFSFEVNRTTFGSSDLAYTTPFDPDLANKKVAIECDSIEIKLGGVVGMSSITDSAFARISYSNIDGTTDLQETFLFGSGTIQLKRGASILGTEPLTLADLTVISINENKELNFLLDGAITNMGATLMPGDSLFFDGAFQVNSLGPFDNQFRQVPNLRGEMYSSRDGMEFSCDNFGDAFTLSKVRVVETFPRTTDWPQGSEDKMMQYVINAGLLEFDDYFGTEYRPSIKVDSLVILFDQNILNAYEVFEPEMSIPNHPVHGLNFFPAPGFDEFPDGRYIIRLDTFQTLPDLNTIRSSEFNFRIRVVGSSEATNGSSSSDSSFYWEPNLYYTSKYYAQNIGDGSCSETVARSADENFFLYDDPPVLSVIPSSDPNLVSIGDTLSYEIRVCNVSTDQRAEISWFSIVDSLGSFDLYSIEDITDPFDIRPLTLQQYGTVNSWFGFADGLEENILSNSVDDRCNIFRIKGRLNSCGLHSYQTQSGWNTVPYSNPAWTPDSIVSAPITSTTITARSQDGNLEGSVIQQPVDGLGLCDTNEVVLVIRNTDLGKIFDMTTQLYLPSPGFNLVSGSVEVAYPSTAAYIPAIGDPILAGTDLRGDRYMYADFSNLHAGLDLNGLDGFDNNNPTGNDNEFLLKFKFTTDCDFLSGSQIFYDVQGVQGCGEPSNFESGETVPIELSLPASNPNLAYSLRFDPKTAFISNTDGQLNVIINNTGTVASSTSDSVEIRLPNNFVYVPSSSGGVEPATYIPGDPVQSNDGPITSYVWGLPDGVVGGDSIMFNFSVTSPIVACDIDSVKVMAFTKASVSALCSSSGMSCDVEVVTSDADGSIVTELPIYNQTLFVVNDNTTSICASPSTETIYFNGIIENIGNDVPAGEATLYYKIDDDGNGIQDPNDVIVDSVKFNGPIIAGAQILWQDTITIASMDICGLYLFGDTTLLGGCNPLAYFVPAPRLLNAGPDIDHCSLASAIVNYQLGDNQCAPNPEFSYTWSSPIAGAESHLSNLNVANPLLNYVYDSSLDTLIYVVETSRSGCESTRDTIIIDMATCSCVPPEIIAEIVVGSRCNESIGSISIDLSLDESLYTFAYTEVFTGTSLSENGSSVSSIPGGAYKVNISDISTGGTCSDSTLIAVPNVDGPQATITTTNATCSAADGTASLLPLSYNYLWTDGQTGANRTDLLAGEYVVRVESPEVPGCYNYIGIEIGVDNGLEATFTIDSFADCGSANGVGTITVLGGSGNYTYSWSSGTATNTALEAGVTLVTITDTDPSACELVLPILMTNGNQAATTITDTTHISCRGNIDGAIVYDVNYEIGFITPVDTVITNGTNVFTNGLLPAGPYCIMLIDAAGCIYGGGCFEINEPEAVGADIIINPSCSSNRTLSVDPKGGTAPYLVDWDDLIGMDDPPTRDGVDGGSYAVTITDANNCSITIDNLVLGTCNSNTSFFRDTIVVDEMPQYCIDASSLSFVTPIDTIINACPSSADGNVGFNIDQDANCINYTGLSIGRDSACIIVCDATMTCDTILMIIDVVAGELLRDTVIRLTDTITYSLNAGALSGAIVDIVDNCPDQNGTDVIFEVDTINYSVTYYGIGLGTDTICLELIDDEGSSYLTTLLVSSRDPVKEIYIDTIFSNQEVSYSFDLSEIGPTAGTIVNNCITPGDTSVSFMIDNSAFRIDYLGLTPGTDTACFISCNAAGVCDTLEMRIHVNFFPDPPVAVVDSASTLVATPITFDLSLNDTIYGALKEVQLVDEPSWGDAFINLDGSMTYNPLPQYCERWDEFRYEICNENSCDTAFVRIFIECTDIKIFNALSPNDDGENDYFHIANIDDFPNNVLRIYNRWNVLVYEVEGYSVEEEERRWKGTWKDEKDLPDGEYYYHLILNDTAQRECKGFLTIFR